jgi:hypothetical protein
MLHQGKRTLLVAPTPVGLEVVLQALMPHEGLLTLVPTGHAGLYLPSLAEQTRRDALQAAERRREASQQREANRVRPEEVQAAAEQLLQQLLENQAALRTLQHRLDDAHAQETALASWEPFCTWQREAQDERDRLAQLQQDWEARRHACTRQRDELTRQHADLEARLQIRQSAGWLSPTRWVALFQADPTPALEACRKQQTEVAAALAALEAEGQSLESAHEAAELRLAQAEQELRQRHQSQWEEEGARQRDALHTQREVLQAQWANLAPGAETLPVEAKSIAELVERARAAQFREDQERAALDNWCHTLQHTDFSASLLASSALVATTPDQLPPTGSFDLVLIDDAQRFDDADLRAAAQRATRCCLAGDAEHAVAPNRFVTIWQQWFTDPRHHATQWDREGNQLVARLRSLDDTDPDCRCIEPLFDHPEIELHIVTPPHGEPYLAEVRFPDQMSVTEARQFLCGEYDTPATEANCPNVRWVVEEQAVVVQIPSQTGRPSGPAVSLAPGVRERLTEGGRVGWCTGALEFEVEAGWTLEKVRQWMREKLGWCPSDRATYLAHPYRFSPALAQALELLRQHRAVASPVLTFLPVPPHGGLRPGNLEVDLTQPERLPRPPLLPHEVRAHLPAQGLVNPAEAQAVVDVLAELLREPQVRQQLHPGAKPAIAVLTPFAAQAVLLRAVIARAEFHPHDGEHIEVALIDEFRPRECLFAVVSLTRSTTARTAPYGPVGDELAVLLTRARERVILVGDPAMLARRALAGGATTGANAEGRPGSLELRLARELLGACPEELDPPASPRPYRSRESSSV